MTSSPLVASVLVAAEASRQVEGAVGSQPGVHPLGEVEDLGRRERFPLPLLPLQPALAAAGRTFLSPPGNHETLLTSARSHMKEVHEPSKLTSALSHKLHLQTLSHWEETFA